MVKKYCIDGENAPALGSGIGKARFYCSAAKIIAP